MPLPSEGEPPLVLVAGGARGQRVTAANRAARMAGTSVGMSHADALATVPGLLSRPAEPEADARGLADLARWCERRYTPIAAVDGEDGLALDVTGCAGLFGGDEAALLLDLNRRLTRAGLTVKAALADTRGAAWALARFARAGGVVPPGGQREALAPLPVAALRLDQATLALLRQLGLGRVGDLYGFPREALARRFRLEGGAVLLRLDQALGLRPEPVAPLKPEPDYRLELAPPEPVLDAAGLAAGLRRLLDRLATRLGRDERGARRLVLEAVRADGERPSVEVRTSRPARDPGHLMRLFAERLPLIDPGFGVELLVLDAPETVPMPPAQAGLGGGDSSPDAEAALALAQLVDRLGAKLGERAVWRPVPVGSHVPERSEASRPVAAGDDGEGAPAWPVGADGAPRPLRLFA
jgi:protein ImuB